MSQIKPIGDKDVLQRKVRPENPRYSKVQSVVESGMTTGLASYMRENEIKVKRQPGENFRRLRTRTIADYIRRQRAPQVLEDGGYAKPMDEYHGGSPSPGAPQPMDYLLLDCRSDEDYVLCHIEGALHYPKIKVNHATNPFLLEMYAYKNKENKLIVLYDLEEEAVTTTANIVFQKGIDNVAIVAGGLREFVQDYSDLITGVSPVPIVPRDTKMQRRAEEATQARSEAARSSVSHKPKSLSNSLAKPKYH